MIWAIVNLPYEISGVTTPSTNLVNHEFNVVATLTYEILIHDMIQYIKDHENPVTLPKEKDHGDHSSLHNVLSQVVMSSEICENLLKFSANSMTNYETFQTERIVTKKKSIFETIHKTNLKKFESTK